MKKIILFLTLISVLISFNSYGGYEHIIANYPFNNLTSNYIDDISSNQYDMLDVNAGTVITSDYRMGNASFHFTGEQENNLNTTLAGVLGNQNIGSFSLWIRTNASGEESFLCLNDYSEGASDYLVWKTGGVGAVHVTADLGSGGTWRIEGNDTINDNTWHFIVATSSGTSTKVYVDGILQDLTFTEGSDDGTWWDETGSGQDTITTGALTRNGGADVYVYDGHIDDVRFWDEELNVTYIRELYDEIIPSKTPSGGGVTPSFNLNTDLETINLTTNRTFYFNSSSFTNITVDLFNCSLYLNDTLNNTLENVGLNLTNQEFTLSYCNEQVGYNVNVTCWRTEQDVYTEQSFLVNDVFLDCVLPELVISSDFTNNSEYYDDTILIYHVNFTDNNLYAINHSIIDLGDNSYKQSFQVENINSSLFMLNVSNFTSDLGIGSYRIDAHVWDSHTNNKVKDLNWYFYANRLYADELYFEGDIVFEEDKTYFYLSEDETKYKLKITFNDDKLKHYLNITSYNENLVFLINSVYKGHFIHFPTKRWIDFEGPNLRKLNIQKLAGNKYQLELILNKESDEIEIESIGDLNYNNATWYFNITEAPDLDDLLLMDINSTNHDINLTLSLIFDEVEDIEGGINMIAFVVLWLGLWIIGYWAITTFNHFIGVGLLGMTIPIDLFFYINMQEHLVFGAGFVGVGFLVMIVFTFYVMIKANFKPYSRKL